MREFECTADGVFIRRDAMESFLLAFGAYRSRGERIILRLSGLAALPNSDADSNIPLAAYLGTLRELQDQFGQAFMRKIATFIFDKAAFPPGLDTLEKAMLGLQQAYLMNHVNGEGKIGQYQWRRTGERTGEMFCDNPYPCAFDSGLVAAVGARFEKDCTVVHQEGSCRHEGGDSCTYDVRW